MLNFEEELYLGIAKPATGGGSGGGGDTVEAINNTGSAISADDKVFIVPLATPQSGANYELIKPKIATNPFFGFLSVYSPTYTGDLTVDLTSKYVSGFYSYKYCTVPLVFDYSHPWEFNICFETGADISTSSAQYMFSQSSGGWGSSGLMFYLYHGELTASFNDSSINEITFFHSYVVSPNTIYYVKVGWTGTQYYLKYSTDGINWTEDAESPVSSTVQTYQNSSQISIGHNDNNTSQYFQGKIYMDKTYMISNGEIVWQMYSDGTSNLRSDILTGIANESIASGAVGEVSVAGSQNNS